MSDIGEIDPVEPRLVVVLPVYNEADSIRAVLAEVKEAAARLAMTGVGTTCILVDDNSPDDTGAIALRYAKSIDLDVAVVSGERNGLGDAMLRGLAAALATAPTAVVTLDGDGQHDPSDIPTLYRAFDARRRGHRHREPLDARRAARRGPRRREPSGRASATGCSGRSRAHEA